MKVLYWLVSCHVPLIVLLLIVEHICFISYKQTSDSSKLRFQMAQHINRETLGRAHSLASLHGGILIWWLSSKASDKKVATAKVSLI